MQFVFQAIVEFIVGLAMPGRDSPFAFRHKPLWARICLIPLSFVLLTVAAVIVTFTIFAIGAFLLGIFRGLSS